MKPPILNIDDIELQPWGHGVKIPGAGEASEHYGAHLGAIGQILGAKKLGYNLTVLAPGKSAFPLHAHTVNEEMFFVIEGEGELRLGEERFPIRQGDVIACPPGGAETAHQIVNTSSQKLKYLGVSTRMFPEVALYPTTQRIGVLGELPAGEGKTRPLRLMSREADSLLHWDGE